MEFDKSRIERLKRSLYSRDEAMVPKEKRTPVKEIDSEVPKNWGEEPSFQFSPESMSKKNNSFFNKFFIFSIVFFLISLGTALFIFFGGLNMISSNNVDIKIIGPSTIASGEDLDFTVSVINNNRVDLDNAVLSIEYPEGTRMVGEVSDPISRDRVELGVLDSSSIKDSSFRVSLFGEKDSIKTLIFRLNYNVSGSNAVFSKEKVYEVVINSSPILLNVNYPSEINSGQELNLTIDVTSNSVVPINNALVKVEYPYGFTYESSSINPARENNVWNLGRLEDGDKKTLRITGRLIGQDLEDRAFRISVGSLTDNSRIDFDTELAVKQALVGIRKSFFDLGFKTTREFFSIGDNVFANISYQNTLPDKLSNNVIEVTFSGNAFDRTGISTNDGGFYRSGDNILVWDKNTTPKLSELSSGEDSGVSFSIRSASNIDNIRSMKNPHIDLGIKMSGNRIDTGESVSSEEKVTIKFSSLLNLSSRVFRSAGGIATEGFIPPRADQETTYIISWIVTNTVNDVSGTTVSATLPVYVSWKGQVSPSNETVTYDPDTRRVTWNLGNLSFGTGFIYSPKQVYFKVGLTPSVNQVGNTPELMGPSSISGRDTYSGQNLNFGTPPVTTIFSDPGFVSGNEKVVN